MYTTIAGYHADDASDHLSQGSVFSKILGKKSLISQPMISKCLNHIDIRMLEKIYYRFLDFAEKAYVVNQPEYVVIDVDSTNIDT